MGTLITELNEVLHILSCLNYIYSSLGGDNVHHQLSNLLARELNLLYFLHADSRLSGHINWFMQGVCSPPFNGICKVFWDNIS